ncbi:MAG: flagellar biosynthetic protein FliQ, partial [Burkholderiales bacterium]
LRVSGWAASVEASLVIELVFQALWMALFLSGPILLGLLIVGLIISILQAATQLNETTVAFVPKIIVLAVVILMAGPSLLGLFSDYVREIILRIPSLMQ